MNSICLNGKLVPAHEPSIMADNRGYRYGDGLFETMKLVNERILLEDLHFERLFAGLELLKFNLPHNLDAGKLKAEIIDLCKNNGCEQLARIRLSVSRGHGGLHDDGGDAQYIIECQPLHPSVNELNENGLVLGVFPDARKSCDVFSHLKSANFLPYVMAARYAKDHQLDDCLVLNTTGAIADATIANLFLIKEGKLITPGLNEGCVDGVTRRFLIEKSKIERLKLKVVEQPVHIEDLLMAEEVFLTNAVSGIRWVKQFRDAIYTNVLTTEIHKRLFERLKE